LRLRRAGLRFAGVSFGSEREVVEVAGLQDEPILLEDGSERSRRAERSHDACVLGCAATAREMPLSEVDVEIAEDVLGECEVADEEIDGVTASVASEFLDVDDLAHVMVSLGLFQSA
jgi:hypothetical protein